MKIAIFWNDPFKPGRIGIGLLIERNNQHGGGIGLGLGGAIAINLFLALFFTAGDLRLYLS